MAGNWIWLPKNKYPNNQATFYNSLEPISDGNYTVCSFKRLYDFGRVPVSVELVFSGDTSFYLTCNGKDIGRGPAYSGGDFIGNSKKRNDYYLFKTEISVEESYLNFFAIVRMMPYHLCEYSRGEGGFYLYGVAHFENGEKLEFGTDSSWDITYLSSYNKPKCYDATIEIDAKVKAEIKNDIWSAEVAPIPPCKLEKFKAHSYKVGAHTSFKTTEEYDKVYAGYIKVKSKANGPVTVNINAFEREERYFLSYCKFDGDGEYYSLELSSIGGLDIEIINESNSDATIEVLFDTSFYPITTFAKAEVSDKDLNTLLDVCAHTLKYCRQSHHLDSPKHCEPLACVGDYYIEMLMTTFSYGDLSLCEFDILRIAKTMEENDGRLFHTTYSLIYVNMLYDYYMLSGNKDLLIKCEKALSLLFNRFKGYMGENGLVETPPDYMFIDWLFPDGISTHHPPKALGQSCLNMFLYGALISGAKIYDVLGKAESSKACMSEAASLKGAILSNLYDKERGLFFEGLNTETPKEYIYQYLPKNVKKKYYRRHANILACYFGILEKNESKILLEKIFTDDSLGEVQPYFMHFWLEAVLRNDEREKYTLSLLDAWKKSITECPKGLVEGFYPPEPSYKFDYSHAWGGTPLYSLPMAILNLEILEPAFKKIRLNPSLLSLDFARIEVPTPYGFITVEISKENGTKISKPQEIDIVD